MSPDPAAGNGKGEPHPAEGTGPAPPKRRWLLGAFSCFLLFFLYRVFAVYTVRSGECRPKPIDPSLRLLTRDEKGRIVSYPERTAFPPQQRPLVIMSFNIEGHAELYRADHINRIAAAINSVNPDIVGLQEVHRRTWQSRFHDQVAELQQLTHLNAFFGNSYTDFHGQFGNLLLTRGEILSAEVHALPSIGEPRTVLESVVKIDGATLNIYVTHLTTWGSINRASRGEQLDCLARHVRTSRYPYVLLGDFNAPPGAPEIVTFRNRNAAQLCGEDIGASHKMTNERIDYIFADYGWDVSGARVVSEGSSDHWPVLAELLWQRKDLHDSQKQ